MTNPFHNGDRVIVQSNHSLQGMEGVVTNAAHNVESGMILVSINGGDPMQWHWSHFELIPGIAATDIVADAMPGTNSWLTESDKEKLSYFDEDVPFYFSCGCFSEWEDHRCGPIMDFKSRYGCRCGAPDDCYCHEDCTGDQGCAQHVEEYLESIVEDHAEAILEDISRNLWK